MNKMCIFEKDELCSNCGECNTCDLNKNKLCNNCSECLKIEGYDVRAVEIDDLYENSDEFSDFQEMDNLHKENHKILSEDSELWSYIDDIKELKDLLNEEGESGLYEEFPGLINYKKSRRE